VIGVFELLKAMFIDRRLDLRKLFWRRRAKRPGGSGS